MLGQGLKVSPENQRLHFRLGVVLEKMGESLGSVNQMEKAIALNPRDASALNHLGYTLAELGIRLEEAEEFIRRALEIKPEDGYITDSLGWDIPSSRARLNSSWMFLSRARTVT